MRFGIVRNQALPWPELLRQWQAFDQLGFDFGWATDHFQRPSDPGGPHMDSWTTLAAVAAKNSLDTARRTGVEQYISTSESAGQAGSHDRPHLERST